MKKILLFILLIGSISATAQIKKNLIVRKGLIRTSGTLCYGSGTNERYYFQGELEYLVHKHVGLNGTSYINIGPFGNYPSQCHSVFSGPTFHLPMNDQFDFSIALQPGLSFVKDNGSEKNSAISELIPNASVVGGVSYYSSFFHVFFQLRANSAYVNDVVKRQSLSELRIAFGLGWNLNLIK